MYDKLKEVESRFEQLEQELSNPDVVSDIDRYTSIMKEVKHLTPGL